MNTPEPNLRDKLLQDIRSGDLAMTPRVYFTLKVLALALTALAVLAVTVLLCTFIYFSIRVSSQDVLLGFGPRGYGAFARFFPWHLLAVDVGLVIMLQWILRNFRTGYRVPVLYLVAALLVAGGILGFALDRMSFNDRLMAQAGRMPGMGRLFEQAHRPLPPGSGICRCTILAIEGNILTVQDTRRATTTLTVVLPLDRPQATTTGLQIGDRVFIAGEESEGVIYAFGVRKEGDRGPRWGRVLPQQNTIPGLAPE